MNNTRLLFAILVVLILIALLLVVLASPQLERLIAEPTMDATRFLATFDAGWATAQAGR